MDKASSNLLTAHLASSRGRGRQIANEKQWYANERSAEVPQTRSLLAHVGCSLSCTNQKVRRILRSSDRRRWQRDCNASMAAYPQLSPFGAAGLLLGRATDRVCSPAFRGRRRAAKNRAEAP